MGLCLYISVLHGGAVVSVLVSHCQLCRSYPGTSLLNHVFENHWLRGNQQNGLLFTCFERVVVVVVVVRYVAHPLHDKTIPLNQSIIIEVHSMP